MSPNDTDMRYKVGTTTTARKGVELMENVNFEEIKTESESK